MIACELDSDACIGTNQKAAEAIDTIMMKMDPCNPVVANRIMHGSPNVAGHGGSGDRFARDLRALIRLSPIMRFLGETCYLHGHGLAFKSPLEN